MEPMTPIKDGIDIRRYTNQPLASFVASILNSECHVGKDGDPILLGEPRYLYQFNTKEEAEEAVCLYLLKQGANP